MLITALQRHCKLHDTLYTFRLTMASVAIVQSITGALTAGFLLAICDSGYRVMCRTRAGRC
jgi:hypothetical protein